MAACAGDQKAWWAHRGEVLEPLVIVNGINPFLLLMDADVGLRARHRLTTASDNKKLEEEKLGWDRLETEAVLHDE